MNLHEYPKEPSAAEKGERNASWKGRTATSWQQSRDDFRAAKAKLGAFLDAEARKATSANAEVSEDRRSNVIDDPNHCSWLAVKAKMKSRLGADFVEAWCDQLAVRQITDREVVMVAPTKFIRHRIEQTSLHEGLLEGWRHLLPNITNVFLIDPQAAIAG